MGYKKPGPVDGGPYTAVFIMSVDHMGVLRDWRPTASEEEVDDFYQSFQSNETSRAFVS
jgi:hypothetical protein